jgi:predicted nuclease with RNAse H fold
MRAQQSVAQLCLENMNGIYGIDYGAKLAGTTVVAFLEGTALHFNASAKKQDADAFLLHFFAERPAGNIFLDAPLSLPKAYAQQGAVNDVIPDFHYRACDRALGAMSPMFLGGLTARAMKLAHQLKGGGHQVQETYPGALARHLGLPALDYKGDKASIIPCLKALQSAVRIDCSMNALPNWHHFDALLALCSAVRQAQGNAMEVGDSDGLIVF